MPPRRIGAHPRPFVALLVVLCLATPGVALAQTQPGPSATARPTEAPGQIVWAFAPEDPLIDGRVAAALSAAMEPSIRGRVPAGSSLVRVESHGPDLRPAPVNPAADVPLLLAAAGYGATPPFVVVGPCRAWSSSPAAADAVSVLDEALQQALAGMGVTVASCTRTTDPAEAHILAWRAGIDAAPPLPQRNQPTFLGAPATRSPLPGPQPGTSIPGGSIRGGSIPSGSSPRPAATGNAGLEADTPRATGRSVLLAALGAMIMLGGRRMTGRA